MHEECPCDSIYMYELATYPNALALQSLVLEMAHCWFFGKEDDIRETNRRLQRPSALPRLSLS